MEGKGFGLFAAQNINEGDLIVEYVGEKIDMDECNRRLCYFYSRDPHSYIFSLNGKYVVDATRKGNVGRFINHSCEPNCHSEKWEVDGNVRLGIFAQRKIEKHEEITIDYQFEKVGSERQACYCGSESCKVYLDKS